MEGIWGLGRRKTATARVRLRPGKGEAVVNGLAFGAYFPTQAMLETALMPLIKLELREKFDVWATVQGGGKAGQAGAVMLGLARALLKADENNQPTLKSGGFLSRDPRMKERKKPGQKGARARYQFSKR